MVTKKRPRTPPDPQIAARLKLAYESLPKNTEGKPPNVTKLDEDARVGRGTLGRAMAGQRGATPQTLRKLAAVLNCDVGWLLTGTGPAPGAALMDIYPSRAAVVAGARVRNVDPGAIAATMAENWHSKDPGGDHWYERLSYHADKLSRLSRTSQDEKKS